MNTKTEILTAAAQITVINDGQVCYPVDTEEMQSWVSENGPITSANYDQFCDDVEYIGCKIATPGNAAMIELCDELLEAGASLENLG